MIIIDDKIETIFIANLTNSFAIDQNKDRKNTIIETIYESSTADDENFFITILNFINYCIDIVHINNILKYDDILRKFQICFKNDLNEYDFNTITNFI